MRSEIRRRVALVGAVSALAGCTAGGPHQPAVADFRPGGCRTVAPAVLSIGELVYDVRHRGKTPASVEPGLTSAQQQLRTLPPVADAAVASGLQQLIAAIGFFRIGVDSHSYLPARAGEVEAAQRALVTQCTNRQPSSGRRS